MTPIRLHPIFLMVVLIVSAICIHPAHADTGPNDITRLIEDPADTSPLGNRIPLILVHGIHGNENEITNIDKITQPNWDYWLPIRAYLFTRHQFNLREKYKVYAFFYESDKFPVRDIGKAFRYWVDARTSQTPNTESKLDDVPFVLLAHSMGGLVSKAFMEDILQAGEWAYGAAGERVLKLITLATPHHGTPGANGAEIITVPQPPPLPPITICTGCLCKEEKDDWKVNVGSLFGSAYYWKGKGHGEPVQPSS